MAEAFLISGFEQARPERAVDFDSRTNDAFRQGVVVSHFKFVFTTETQRHREEKAEIQNQAAVFLVSCFQFLFLCVSVPLW